jgi:hypothetical protein
MKWWTFIHRDGSLWHQLQLDLVPSVLWSPSGISLALILLVSLPTTSQLSTVTKFALWLLTYISQESGSESQALLSSNPGLDSRFLWTCSRGLPVECRPAYLCTVTLQVCIVHVCHPPNIFHRPKDFLRQVHESWSLCFKVLIIDNVLCIPDR